MIAKGVKIFCCEDPRLIENYELAIADKTQMWECHHRNGIQYSKAELIEMGLYFNRPASELIFLPVSEHRILHNKNRKYSQESKTKMSVIRKGKYCGKNNPMYGRTAEKSPVSRFVYQLDKITGEIIKEWKCISDAAKALKKAQPNITSCCRGYIKSAGGFKWEYKL